MSFIRRLFGRGDPGAEPATADDAKAGSDPAPTTTSRPLANAQPPPTDQPFATVQPFAPARPFAPAAPFASAQPFAPAQPLSPPGPEARTEPARPEPQVCPYCRSVLDPVPVRTRRCPKCHQQINVRRVDGHSVLLSDDEVPIFERKRERAIEEQHWATERTRWLALAELVGAPGDRRAQLAAAHPSPSVIDEARELYLSSAERAARTARTTKRWPEVARIRRQQATELYRDAGSPVPPPEDVVALHREGMLAELRDLSSLSGFAELVSVRCCPICRADDEQTFRIAVELRTPRLPHAGCPKGLCGCQWWLAMPAPKTPRRKRPAKPSSAGHTSATSDAGDDGDASEAPSTGDAVHRPIADGLD